LFQLIHEDDDFLVVNKPADLVCHPTKGDAYSSLISQVRLHLGPNSTPQLINRLDRETSGVVLVGKSPAVTREARRVWESRGVHKEYWAFVHGWVEPADGTIDAPLGKDERSAVAIKDTVRSDGAPARTEFHVHGRFVRCGEQFSFLLVRPTTGRKHQIRIHLAWTGHPLVGDKLYGPDETLYLALVEGRLTDADRARLILPCHALHARSIRFPWHGAERQYRAEPEPWFTEFATEAGIALPAD
jgi:23S rRNA pseudouridine1911/1915/1917 synthase